MSMPEDVNEFDPEMEAFAITVIAQGGGSIGKVLSAGLDKKARSAAERAELIVKMAKAAGIEESTVRQITNGGITCPPAERLAGLAGPLGMSAAILRAAGNKDGCAYGSD